MRIEDLEKTTDKTLYLRRDLVNHRDLVEWAKGQGIEIKDPESLHVTIVYSKSPVSWDVYDVDDEEVVVENDDERGISVFGEATVLTFTSPTLTLRHDEFSEIGASFDYDEYRPHVTFSYDKEVSKIADKIEPYSGPLVFGKEVREEIEDES